MTEISRNYIGGDWVEGPHVSEDINPSNTDDVVGRFVHADAAQAQTAIAAAKDAFPAWSRSGIQMRHDILKRVGDEVLARKDEIGRILSREEGKTLGGVDGLGRANSEQVPCVLDFCFLAGRF
jgi:alpha-ketoglutaric semialdehyde dehydrogenase